MSGFSQAELFKYLNPNFETGDIYFKFRNSTEFPSERIANGWNTRFAGKIAGSVSANGYKYIGIKGKRLLQHRVLWFMLTGMIPVEIDQRTAILLTIVFVICETRQRAKIPITQKLIVVIRPDTEVSTITKIEIYTLLRLL